MSIKHGSIALFLVLTALANPLMSALAAEPAAVPAAASGGKAQSEDFSLECVDPHSCCAESEKVIDTLKKMVDLLLHGDLVSYEKFIDDGCTTYDEGTKKMIVGKQAVIEELKKKMYEHGPNGPSPLITYTIDHPYAKVTGDTAVVTFVAYKEIGGKHPYKAKSHVTDVFVKHGDIWKKLHYRGRWQRTGQTATTKPAPPGSHS